MLGKCPILESLIRCVRVNKLGNVYTLEALQSLAARLRWVSGEVTALAQKWKLGSKVMYDLYQVSLYDVIMLCDDSGSMRIEEDGSRIEDLKAAVGYVSECASIFDLDGISVRFINSNIESDHIVSCEAASKLISQVPFVGLTPLGTSLYEKVLQPFFFHPLNQGKLKKPLLIIVITDGQPQGEPRDKVETVIAACLKHRNDMGNLVAFQFAQVGTDRSAQEFLTRLDTHCMIGDCVDVTRNYEMEGMLFQKNQLILTPEIYIAKLLLGPIDPFYDKMDE